MYLTPCVWRRYAEYLTTDEAAKKWIMSGRCVTVFCDEGRINGATRKGVMSLIPADTV